MHGGIANADREKAAATFNATFPVRILTAPCPRRGRRKPLEKRCRRERCNARQRTMPTRQIEITGHLGRRQTAAPLSDLVQKNGGHGGPPHWCDGIRCSSAGIGATSRRNLLRRRSLLRLLLRLPGGPFPDRRPSSTMPGRRRTYLPAP